MRHGLWHGADIASLKIEGARIALRRKYRHARFAGDVKLPFIGIWMPMNLANPAGLDLDQRGGNIA